MSEGLNDKPSHEAVAEAISRVEAELKRIGYWRNEPLPPEMYQFTQAFAMDTMPFSYWLQFIFIPRVRSIIEEGGDFPRTSMVAVQAVREFDGVPETSELVTILSEFDALFALKPDEFFSLALRHYPSRLAHASEVRGSWMT